MMIWVWLVPDCAVSARPSLLLNSCSSCPPAYPISAGIMFVQEEALASSLSSTDSLPPEERPIAQDCSDSLESIPTGQVMLFRAAGTLSSAMLLLSDTVHSETWPGWGVVHVARASGVLGLSLGCVSSWVLLIDQEVKGLSLASSTPWELGSTVSWAWRQGRWEFFEHT